ncbi:MAG: ABC transporter ATP-binding protein [Candidatus Pacebacteria bacterium]|nr:ABC transporter ATP-binding protein [Candidatus Paceibacterota bacterium]
MSKSRTFLRDFCGPYVRPMIAVLALLALQQSVNLFIPWVQGRIFDAILTGGTRAHIYTLIALTGVVLIIVNVIETIRWKYAAYQLTNPFVRHIARVSMERLLSLSIGQHVSEHSGIKQSVISNGQNALRAVLDIILYELLPLVMELGVVIVLLLMYRWELGVTLLIGSIIYGVWAHRMNRIIHPFLAEQEVLRNHENKFRGEILRNSELVLQSAQEERAIQESDTSMELVQRGLRGIWVPYVNEATIRENALIATRIAILIIGVRLTQTGACTAGALVTYWMWAISALSRVGRIGPVTRTVMEHMASIDKFYHLMTTEPDIVDAIRPNRPQRYQGDITFEHVTLHYHRRDSKESQQPADETKHASLNDVSFHIPAGGKIALVGESGAGKSSIVYTLLRSQDPNSGRILIDGFDLKRELDHRHLRSRIGFVPQHTFLFDKSLRDNITYGLPLEEERKVTDEDLRRVIHMARIDRFVSRMECGLDTLIGERGVKLSGGERQRVGIARALIRDPDILIFDEATSSLDPRNEFEIQEELDAASVGRTTIIIAHRYSTIRNVDSIIVMDRGSIAGRGTHDELMMTCDAYRTLIQHQQAGL